MMLLSFIKLRPIIDSNAIVYTVETKIAIIFNRGVGIRYKKYSIFM